MKKSKVYLQMFISYVFILLMPIILAVILYGYTLNIVRSQAEEMNMNLLKMVRQEIDYELNNVYTVAVKTAMDNQIQYLAGKNNFTSSDQFNLYEVFVELDGILLSEDFIDSIFVVLNNTQKTLSATGNMSNELYYELHYKSSELSYDEYAAYMQEFHHGDFLTVHKENGEDVFLYTMSTINRNVGDQSATVCLEINYNKIKERLNALKESDDTDVLILTDLNETVCVDEAISEQYSFQYNAEDLDYSSRIGNIDKETIISVLPSEINSWQYISIIPASHIEVEAKKVQNVAVLLLFLSLLCGLCFSYYMSNKNYNPIQMIMEKFKKESNTEIGKGENEFRWLNNQIEQFFEKHIDTQRLLKQNRRNMKDYYLHQLLQNYCSEKPSEQYGIKIQGTYNIVLLFVPKSAGEDAGVSAESIEENALHKFTIMNVFEEMCSEYYTLDMAELGERVAVIISLPDDDKRHIEKLKNIAENAQQLLEEYFRFTGTILFGSICQGWSGIHESHLQAVKLIEYINLLDANILVYDELKDIQPQYYYPVEIEQKIVNAIKAGDNELAKETMAEIFDRNLQGQVTSNIYRCLIYGMIGTLLDGASQGGYKNAASELVMPNGDLSRISVGKVRREFGELVDKICEKIRVAQQETSRDNTLSKRVQKYILENYHDPDLNISIASQYFDLTPAYLSTAYKKQTGESLLEYINKVRMINAERLLEEGYGVAEVAEMAGFRDSGTFIRVFKKKKGITPGQFKKDKTDNP